MPRDAKDHYNDVTDAWKEFMGDHFHFGYFETGDTDLSRAGELMVDKMLELCEISESSRILDVGCGIGGPAFYIHDKMNCAIDGISTSEQGVQFANVASREKGFDDVRFKVANGLDNGFPDNTFDTVWVMETSHLIPDRRKLFQECHRVLKDHGTLVLCDFMLMLRPLYRAVFHFALHGRRYIRSMRTWGPVQLGYPGHYCHALISAGFREVTVIDVTAQAAPTAKCWKDSALRFRDSATDTSLRDEADEFIFGCEVIEDLFEKGIVGYGICRAMK